MERQIVLWVIGAPSPSQGTFSLVIDGPSCSRRPPLLEGRPGPGALRSLVFGMFLWKPPLLLSDLLPGGLFDAQQGQVNATAISGHFTTSGPLPLRKEICDDSVTLLLLAPWHCHLGTAALFSHSYAGSSPRSVLFPTLGALLRWGLSVEAGHIPALLGLPAVGATEGAAPLEVKVPPLAIPGLDLLQLSLQFSPQLLVVDGAEEAPTGSSRGHEAHPADGRRPLLPQRHGDAAGRGCHAGKKAL